jgi:DNA repair exonuclease SbcCD ATPase subunit
MIIFKKIGFKNFLSFGNYWTEIPLSEHPTTLIIGKNGSGKSTTISALIYVLFGKSNRDSIKQLINSINKKELEVFVEFQKGADHFRIERGISPKIFNIHKNGELLNQEASSRDYQKILENEILGLNYKTFHQTIVLSTASFVPFMKLPAATRREVIEDILDISIFSKMKVVLKKRLDDNQNQLTNLVNDIRLQKERIRQHKEYQKKLQEHNEEQEQKLLGKIKERKEQRKEIHQKLQKKTNELIELEKEFIPKQKEYDKKNKQIMEKDSQTKSSIKEIRQKIEFFDTNDVCPTCAQNISIEVKQQSKGKEKQKIKEIKDIVESLEKEKNLLREEAKQIKELNEKWNHLKWTEIQELSFYLSKLDNEIPDLEQELLSSSKNSVLDKSVIGEYDDLYEELIRLEEQRNDELEKQSYLGTIKEFLKDDGIKGMMVRNYLPVINDLLNKYLNIMDFFVSFYFDEHFNETVLSRHRDNFTFGSFSEGEKSRLNLAILFTFRQIAKIKNSTSCNLLFLDEVFDSSLDKDGLDKLIEILDSEGENNSNIVVISHSEDVQQMNFSRKFFVEKSSNFSRVVVVADDTPTY